MAHTTASPSDDKSMPDLAGELWQLVLAYVKQETIDPVKALGRFVVFGVAGSVFLVIGLVLLVIGGLRALQTETGTVFQGAHSWLPYVITTFGSLVVVGLAAARIAKGGK